MAPWVSRSRPGTQTVVAAGSTAVGVALMFGSRAFSTPGANSLTGFLLGLLLLLVGIAGVLAGGEQTVTVDPTMRSIMVEDRYLFGARSRVIPFPEIKSVSIGYLGKASNYVQRYYLVLHLTSGAEYPLFSPGRFFPGGSDRSTVEGWRQRLQECMGTRGAAG